jgi:hypothetical protein
MPQLDDALYQVRSLAMCSIHRRRASVEALQVATTSSAGAIRFNRCRSDYGLAPTENCSSRGD